MQNVNQFQSVGQSVSYFPTQEQYGQNDDHKTLEVFKDFSTCLYEVENLTFDEDAIAFFIEATKQLYQKDWTEQVSAVKEKISQYQKIGGDVAAKQTSWLLSQLVTNLYEQVLTQNALKAGKESTRFFGTLLKLASSIQKSNMSLKEKNVTLHIGGINKMFIPKWYTKQ